MSDSCVKEMSKTRTFAVIARSIPCDEAISRYIVWDFFALPGSQ